MPYRALVLSSDLDPEADRVLVLRSWKKERFLRSVSQHSRNTLFLYFASDLALVEKRWHLDCFKCSTCSTILDSNLILLSDNSYIYRNYYNPDSAYREEIEDIAILTGDKAFCRQCFKCRNCKRLIENLKYARTSQGIFCMACDMSLTARRRRKMAREKKEEEGDTRRRLLDNWSLPSLPPKVVYNFNDVDDLNTVSK